MMSQSPCDCEFIFFLFCGIVYDVTTVASSDIQKNEREFTMSVVTKRLIIIAAIVIVAFILESYGLVVYLHAGGFTSGDKNADTKMLQWLCEKGYVAADRRGIRWR